MDVTKHSIVKVIKDVYVVLAVIHRPAKIGLALGNGAVVEGNVDGVFVSWLYPIVAIKNRQNI